MSGKGRFFIGFVLGLFLMGSGFLLAGIGHGTYAPLICNAGVLGFMFPPFTLFLPPFQWGLYLALIPGIDSSRWRTFWVAIVIVAHLVPGVWVATEDEAFARAMNQDSVTLFIYSALLVITLAVLAFMGVQGTRSQKN